jgi:PKD repeat protein
MRELDSYEWNFGDGNNSSSTSPWHLYSDTGTYSVTLVAINGFCPNDTLLINNYITVLSPLGLFESINSGFQYSIFPNPAKEEIMLNVLSEREFVAAIEIINVSGQTIYSLTHKINTGETNIPINNIKHLSSGSYLLKINSGNSSNSRIFIKE